MARCGCSGATCSCLVTGGGAVTVTGTGSVTNPYVITTNLNLQVADTSSIDFTLTGNGSAASPYIISGSSALNLDDLLDVVVAGATTGQVLAKQANGTWAGVAATTAPTGAINLSSTGGLLGDGSAGNPLGIKLPAGSGLTLDSTGLRVTGASGSAWTTWAPAWTATTTNPAIGNGSIEATYTQLGKTVTISIELNIGSTTTRGVGFWRLGLPVAPIASRHQVLAMQVNSSGSADYVGVAKIEGQQRIERMFIATSTAGQSLSHSVPAALAAGSQIMISGTYEAA